MTDVKFELRFEERAERAERPGISSIEKVLQFRTKDVHRESSTTTPLEPKWSDWKDVPVVQKVD